MSTEVDGSKDNFVNIKNDRDTLDVYFHRKAIVSSLTNRLPFFAGKLLDVGCGKMPYRNFITTNSTVSSYLGMDIEGALKYDSVIKPDILWDGKAMPLENNTFDIVMATEVFEHCPDTNLVLSEIYRVLKPGGFLFFTVPFLWPLHEVPYDEYRFTPFSLDRELRKVGFLDIDIKPLGGWHASMAQMLGLWIKRAPMNKLTRNMIIPFIRPIQSYLIKRDVIAKKWKESTMITGLVGFIRK
ncbi:class I SAM-dependent methyltransferase [Chryseolinea lacunae]|uniref:Class I SAM-dependent methyltransferase n=1 Tax=Chryseolinea lacunae TaxID=2801331 RepID=A0ABS1KXB9_9BACT|nr:class I SAM-dependent methyltransferase [Chryseolinea lacunae]MBL0744034.1 class I SAM-dependent methyltransferase [Chryseolinea lacunae]